MTRKETFQKVQEIFRDIFDDESIILTENTTSDDIEEWDSLNHLNLMGAIGDEFGYKFSLDEMAKLHSVGAIVDTVSKS